MDKYRIKIEKIEGKKYHHMAQIVLFSDSFNSILSKISSKFNKEINLYLEDKFKYKELPLNMSLIGKANSDFFDYKGKDISKEEFFNNEIELEIYNS